MCWAAFRSSDGGRQSWADCSAKGLGGAPDCRWRSFGVETTSADIIVSSRHDRSRARGRRGRERTPRRPHTARAATANDHGAAQDTRTAAQSRGAYREWSIRALPSGSLKWAM